MTAAFAYLNARIRGRKTRLLGVDRLIGLSTSDAPAGIVPEWREYSASDSPAPVLAVMYRRLIDEYVFALRASHDASVVILALVHLHEIENVKLAWRAIAGDRAPQSWAAVWRPIGPLASVSLESCREARTLRALVDVLRRSPYFEPASAALRAHEKDTEAAEIAFDRWSIDHIQRAVDALPRRDKTARELLVCVVDERRAALAARAGRPAAIKPLQIRAKRRVMSARAFRGNPYCLAPLVAYLLAREDEARGLLTVAEARLRRLDADAVRKVLHLVM